MSDTEVLLVVQRPSGGGEASTDVDVVVEVQCDAGQFVVAAMSQGFPVENRYSLTISVTDGLNDVSAQLSGITEVSRDGVVRFGSCGRPV